MFISVAYSLCIYLSVLITTAWSAPVVLDKRYYGFDNRTYQRRNYDTIRSIYNLTVYPNQLPILVQGAAGVPPGLFNQNATGRVSPVGAFEGFDDSIEYFFALAPIPQSNPLFTSISRMEITEFSSGCPEVAASVVYLYCNVTNPGAANNGMSIAPLKQVAFWRFDQQGAVLKYDAWLPNLGAWTAAAIGVQINNLQAQATTIEQICTITQVRCTGAIAQWNSTEECVSVLSGKPYGNYDEAWGDNIVCRSIHLLLTVLRPEVHCPHVGPTGGDKCFDYGYPLQYFSDQSLYNSPIGKTFSCPSISGK